MQKITDKDMYDFLTNSSYSFLNNLKNIKVMKSRITGDWLLNPELILKFALLGHDTYIKFAEVTAEVNKGAMVHELNHGDDMIMAFYLWLKDRD